MEPTTNSQGSPPDDNQDVSTPTPTTTQDGTDVTAPTTTTTAPPTGTQSDGQPLGTGSGNAPNADNPLSTTGGDAAGTPTSTPTTTSGDPAPANTSDVTKAQVEAYLKANPDQVGELLADLDESTSDEQEAGQRQFIEGYLKAHPAYAHTLTGLTTDTTDQGPATTPPTPTDPTTPTEPTSPPPATTPTEPTKPVRQPVPFPAPLLYSIGGACQVKLGTATVDATVKGIYYDSDGLTYQVEVHVQDGVPMLGTSARTLKLDVPADLLMDAS